MLLSKQPLCVWMIVLAVSAVSLSGCGGEPTAENPAPEQPSLPPPAPEEPADPGPSEDDLALVSLYEQASAAYAAKDFATLATYMTDDSVDSIAGALLMYGSTVQSVAELARQASQLLSGLPEGAGGTEEASDVANKLSEVLAQHGLADVNPSQLTAGGAGASPVLARIADKPAFIADMYAALSETPTTSSAAELMLSRLDPFFGELQRVEIVEGTNAAVGFVSRTVNGIEVKSNVPFQRTTEGWRIVAPLDLLKNPVE